MPLPCVSARSVLVFTSAKQHYVRARVDLKVSPEGEGFNPNIQTIKIGDLSEDFQEIMAQGLKAEYERIQDKLIKLIKDEK